MPERLMKSWLTVYKRHWIAMFHPQNRTELLIVTIRKMGMNL